eukprot:362009-Chlamydomonas_euryale.AAC.18
MEIACYGSVIMSSDTVAHGADLQLRMLDVRLLCGNGDLVHLGGTRGLALRALPAGVRTECLPKRVPAPLQHHASIDWVFRGADPEESSGGRSANAIFLAVRGKRCQLSASANSFWRNPPATGQVRQHPILALTPGIFWMARVRPSMQEGVSA